eukprot:9122745-Alexandrium_andersonii.AAC.1
MPSSSGKRLSNSGLPSKYTRYASTAWSRVIARSCTGCTNQTGTGADHAQCRAGGAAWCAAAIRSAPAWATGAVARSPPSSDTQ